MTTVAELCEAVERVGTMPTTITELRQVARLHPGPFSVRFGGGMMPVLDHRERIIAYAIEIRNESGNVLSLDEISVAVANLHLPEGAAS